MSQATEPQDTGKGETRGWIVAGLLLCLVVAGAGVEFARDRTTVSGAAQPAKSTATPAVKIGRALSDPVLVDVGLPLPLKPFGARALAAPEAPLVTLLSDDEAPNSGLWSVTTSASETVLQRLLPTPAPRVPMATAAEPEAVDVARWRRGEVAAFLMDERPDGTLDIDIRSPEPGARRLARYAIPSPARPANAERTLQVGRWSGPRADLFVVDRALPRAQARLIILSGESRFRETLLNVPLVRGGGFPRRDWSLDLRDAGGSGAPDLVFTTRQDRTGSGNVEVHALAAQTHYTRFLLQVPTGERAAEPTTTRATTLTVGGRPALLLVDPRTRQASGYYLRAEAGGRTARR